jgi:hypothetical protein
MREQKRKRVHMKKRKGLSSFAEVCNKVQHPSALDK